MTLATIFNSPVINSGPLFGGKCVFVRARRMLSGSSVLRSRWQKGGVVSTYRHHWKSTLGLDFPNGSKFLNPPHRLVFLTPAGSGGGKRQMIIVSASTQFYPSYGPRPTEGPNQMQLPINPRTSFPLSQYLFQRALKTWGPSIWMHCRVLQQNLLAQKHGDHPVLPATSRPYHPTDVASFTAASLYERAARTHSYFWGLGRIRTGGIFSPLAAPNHLQMMKISGKWRVGVRKENYF
ncbi:hypothetical protein B0H10DRAFT_1947833 [Mycena sp. CBHHK59/15]|nr:hypothetical protein B0H10DRAFT_1958471 [Mycena sp. CBHHK59/15]KAJ6618031.1 hypothetical protein B0H10DRAFT_1947833 [Mycena sp. CBHHK59/15]